MPDDWQPGGDDALFATRLGLDVAEAAAEFRDYWRGVPGARGRKLDWSATFRNRCRERAARRHSHQRETASDRRRRELGIPSILDFERDNDAPGGLTYDA